MITAITATATANSQIENTLPLSELKSANAAIQHTVGIEVEPGITIKGAFVDLSNGTYQLHRDFEVDSVDASKVKPQLVMLMKGHQRTQ